MEGADGERDGRWVKEGARNHDGAGRGVGGRCLARMGGVSDARQILLVRTHVCVSGNTIPSERTSLPPKRRREMLSGAMGREVQSLPNSMNKSSTTRDGERCPRGHRARAHMPQAPLPRLASPPPVRPPPCICAAPPRLRPARRAQESRARGDAPRCCASAAGPRVARPAARAAAARLAPHAACRVSQEERTARHVAASEGQAEAVGALVAAGAGVDAKDVSCGGWGREGSGR